MKIFGKILPNAQKTIKINLIKMNYNVKNLENYYSDQAHKLARHPHNIYGDWIETFVSLYAF